MLLYLWVGRNSITVSGQCRRFVCLALTARGLHQPIKKFDQIFLQGKHMNKSVLIVAIAALGLAACGKEEPKVVPAPKVEVVVPAAPVAPVVVPAVDAAKAAADVSKDAAVKSVDAAKDAKDAAGKSVDAAKDAKDAAGKAVEAAKAAAPATKDAAPKK